VGGRVCFEMALAPEVWRMRFVEDAQIKDDPGRCLGSRASRVIRGRGWIRDHSA
jgi:hypothetical protein